MKKYVWLCLVLCMVGVTELSANENPSRAVFKPSVDKLMLAHVKRRFIGCVKDRHACEHLAEAHGHSQASLRYNERHCARRPHLACYAW